MNMNNEIWKDIPGYEGYYQVSNLGRVRSLDRYINHWRGGLRKINGKIVEGVYNRGYLRVTLTNRKRYMIHQLVAMAFLSHQPSGMKVTIDHKDNNKLNNALSNLEIVSMRENNIRRCKLYKKNDLPIGVYEVTVDKTYRAIITIDKKKVNLGYYITQEEASNAYQKKLKEIYE